MLQTLTSSLGKFEPLFSGELRKFKPSLPLYKGGEAPTIFCVLFLIHGKICFSQSLLLSCLNLFCFCFFSEKKIILNGGKSRLRWHQFYINFQQAEVTFSADILNAYHYGEVWINVGTNEFYCQCCSFMYNHNSIVFLIFIEYE